MYDLDGIRHKSFSDRSIMPSIIPSVIHKMFLLLEYRGRIRCTKNKEIAFKDEFQSEIYILCRNTFDNVYSGEIGRV